MTHSTPSDSPMLASMETLIDLTREQAKTIHLAQPLGGRKRAQGEKEPLSHTLDDLNLFIVRLYQVKEWLIQDPQLLRLVDTHMSQHVRAMEKRQSMQNVWLSIINLLAGAILGWLSSVLASPIILWHLLFH